MGHGSGRMLAVCCSWTLNIYLQHGWASNILSVWSCMKWRIGNLCHLRFGMSTKCLIFGQYGHIHIPIYDELLIRLERASYQFYPHTNTYYHISGSSSPWVVKFGRVIATSEWIVGDFQNGPVLGCLHVFNSYQMFISFLHGVHSRSLLLCECLFRSTNKDKIMSSLK